MNQQPIWNQMTTLISTLLLMAMSVLHVNSARSAEPIENLTVDQAIRIAEREHPDLAEARALTDAAAARRAQAGQLPNPETVARMESAPVDRRTADSAEYVAGVSQSIPLGGRLSAAREVARREEDAARARADRAAREVRRRVHAAFATALYFQAARQGFTNNLAGTRALSRLVRSRLAAGDALPIDVARAEMDELQAQAEAKAAEAAAQLSLAELSAAISATRRRIGTVQGSLADVFALAEMHNVLHSSGTSPDLRVAEAEAAALRARVRLARAEAIPDINLDLFYRRLQETRQDAFDAGIRVPIPLLRRPGVRVREADAEATAAEARAESTRLAAEQAWHRAISILDRELTSAASLKTEIIPRAQLVATNAEFRYQAGDANLVEVLQARRDLTAVQHRYLAQLQAVHEAWQTLATL